MSYWLHVGNDDGINVTWNLSNMLTKAFGSEMHYTDLLNNTLGLHSLPLIDKALHRLKRDEGYYRQFEASNGWGTYENALEFLEHIKMRCSEEPEEEITIS